MSDDNTPFGLATPAADVGYIDAKHCSSFTFKSVSRGTVRVRGEEGLKSLVDIVHASWRDGGTVIVECEQIIFEPDTPKEPT